MEKENHYDILQISLKAEEEVIKVAFRELAKKYHPDTLGNNKTLGKMQKINEAYETLSDPAKKREYDIHIGNNTNVHSDTNESSSNTSSTGNYSNAKDQNTSKDPREDLYNKAIQLRNSSVKANDYINAAELFESISGYKDATLLAVECRKYAQKQKFREEIEKKEQIYNQAIQMKNQSKNSMGFSKAFALFFSLKGYKDSEYMCEECDKLAKKEEESEKIKEKLNIQNKQRAERFRKFEKEKQKNVKIEDSSEQTSSLIGTIFRFSSFTVLAVSISMSKWLEALLLLIAFGFIDYLIRYFEKRSVFRRLKRRYVNTINNLNGDILDYEIDYKDAIKNIKESLLGFEIDYCLATDGDLNSMCRVGYCYQHGKGVKRDMEQAVYWYEKSAYSGNENARIVLEKLNK